MSSSTNEWKTSKQYSSHQIPTDVCQIAMNVQVIGFAAWGLYIKWLIGSVGDTMALGVTVKTALCLSCLSIKGNKNLCVLLSKHNFLLLTKFQSLQSLYRRVFIFCVWFRFEVLLCHCENLFSSTLVRVQRFYYFYHNYILWHTVSNNFILR